MIPKSFPDYPLTSPSTLVAISGSGNVAQFTALKVIELGATVLSLSDSKGSLISTSTSGISAEVVNKVSALKLKGGSLSEIKEEGYEYHAGKRPWTLLPKVHIALPSATQNEVSGEEAEALIKAGVKIVAEGSNMVRESALDGLGSIADHVLLLCRDVPKMPSKSSKRLDPSTVVSGMLQEKRPTAVVLPFLVLR